VTAALSQPWAIEPLPDGRLLVSEKRGTLQIVLNDGSALMSVKGLPPVLFDGQAGLHDIALDPAFEGNRLVYLTYAEPREGGTGTTLARGVLVEGAQGATLQDVQIIFRQMPTLDSVRQMGSRVAFGKDGKLYLALGERGIEGAGGEAQDLMSDFGKVVRLESDGRIPADNPFAGRSDAWPQIWSSGHRNIQAMAVDAADDMLWAIEHGPRGGDELNRIDRGRNYGWPVITYGIDYPGGKVGAGLTQRDGLEQPIYYWNPVIAPSGMMVYRGAEFPEWQGSIFVGGLVGGYLVRLQMQDGRVAGEEWLLQDRRRRIRDVLQGPDGAIYVVHEYGDASELLRLTRAR
jgi:glucose/arabinose dehydrogenase